MLSSLPIPIAWLNPAEAQTVRDRDVRRGPFFTLCKYGCDAQPDDMSATGSLFYPLAGQGVEASLASAGRSIPV